MFLSVEYQSIIDALMFTSIQCNFIIDIFMFASVEYHFSINDLIWFDLLCIRPLSAIFQLYHGDQF